MFCPDHLALVRQPVHWRSVQIYKFDSRDRVFHNDCTFRCDEDSQVFGVQVVQSSSEFRCYCGFLTTFAAPFCIAAGRTRLPRRFLTLSGHFLEMSRLATCAALRIAQPTR